LDDQGAGRSSPVEPANPVQRSTAGGVEELQLIVSARDGHGNVGRNLPRIQASLEARGLEYRVQRVGHPADAVEATRDALARGSRRLVAVGGDRLVRAVVNAMMDDEGPRNPDATLAVVAAGSGCDFVRTFGLPEDAEEAAARLPGEVEYPVDVARLTLTGPGGEERTTFFAGLAEVGLGGAVQARAARLSRWERGGAYFLAFWWTLAVFRAPDVRITVGNKEFRGRAHNVVIGNCQFARNGIRVSPRSFPGDGFLDVLVYHGPKSNAYTMLPRMFRGEQVPDPNILEMRGRRIRIEADRPLPVHADGDPLGTTPVTVELLPQALRLRV
jgi:diacylglycerol kinase (ATP)